MKAATLALLRQIAGITVACLVASITPWLAFGDRGPWWSFVSVGFVIGWLYPSRKNRRK